MFNSPNYPSMYPNDLNCTWKLSVPQGYRVKLNFTQFELEWSEECRYDSVVVKSKNDTLGKYCGRRPLQSRKQEHILPQEPFLAPDNLLQVVLSTDHSNEVEVHGFQAHFVAIDVDECLINNGGCAHFCHNYIGGYYCSCERSHRLTKDGYGCIGKYIKS